MARHGVRLDPLEATLRSQRSEEIASEADRTQNTRLRKTTLVIGAIFAVAFVLYVLVVGLLGRSDSPPNRDVDPFLTPATR